jgi:hypothetical protein
MTCERFLSRHDFAESSTGNPFGFSNFYDSVQANRRGAKFQRIVVLSRPRNAGGENHE